MLLQNNDTQAPMVRVVLLLIEALSQYAVKLGNADTDFFQEACQRIAGDVKTATDPERHMVLAGRLIEALDEYHKTVERTFRATTKELKSMVGVSVDALVKISSCSESAAEELNEIGREVNKATQVREVRALSARIAMAADMLCEEAAQKAVRFAEIQQELKQIGTANIASRPNEIEIDPVTSLPSLAKGIDLLGQVAQGADNVFVLAICMERLDLLNHRFGYASGDQAMRLYSQHIAKNLHNEDQLFRWRGPCIVAVLKNRNSIDVVRNEAAHLLTSKLEHHVELGNRSVMLALSAAWSVFPLGKPVDCPDLSRKIDQFVGEQVRPVPA